jgi:hypothetical protein
MTVSIFVTVVGYLTPYHKQMEPGLATLGILGGVRTGWWWAPHKEDNVFSTKTMKLTAAHCTLASLLDVTYGRMAHPVINLEISIMNELTRCLPTWF